MPGDYIRDTMIPAKTKVTRRLVMSSGAEYLTLPLSNHVEGFTHMSSEDLPSNLPGQGLHVWEHEQWTETGETLRKEFRAPTEDEWDAVRDGEPPWTEDGFTLTRRTRVRLRTAREALALPEPNAHETKDVLQRYVSELHAGIAALQSTDSRSPVLNTEIARQERELVERYDRTNARLKALTTSSPT
jgi:hypothetical protein